MKSWIRNLSGFFYNIIKRVALGSFKAKEVKRIYNYHKVPNLFETSGQPGKQQLKLLAKRGYEVVINLAPSSLLEGAVINEAEILSLEQVEYIHIPVDFSSPTDEDFAEFAKNSSENLGLVRHLTLPTVQRCARACARARARGRNAPISENRWESMEIRPPRKR